MKTQVTLARVLVILVALPSFPASLISLVMLFVGLAGDAQLSLQTLGLVALCLVNPLHAFFSVRAAIHIGKPKSFTKVLPALVVPALVFPGGLAAALFSDFPMGAVSLVWALFGCAAFVFTAQAAFRSSRLLATATA